MKNYGHTWQWGKNPEYTIDVGTHWDQWAILFEINWCLFKDALYNKCYSFTIRFLCFHSSIEIWRWAK